MLSIFQFENYKDFFNKWILTQPKSGYGQYRKLANHLGINSVVVSQIFKGDRELSLEQAILMNEFIGLTDLEKDYFILLVQLSRAGSHELKKYISNQIENIRKTALSLKSRVRHQKLNDEAKSIFYSQWYFSAVRLSTSIEGINSAQNIAQLLRLDVSTIKKVLDFLIEHQLIVEEKGHFKLGPPVTHIDADSPYVIKHHTNWRLKAIQSLEKNSSESLHYSGPMALSEKLAKEIRENLVSIIQSTTQKVQMSESEKLSCLNIDWFTIK